jgi:excinuclease Cho
MPRRSINTGASDHYAYPEHLRDAIISLPNAPGVYLFHGDNTEGVPLYIGKSINIRQRVMSHLRTPDEYRMLLQSRTITFIRTAGEIGALLLEARLIKERQPLFNQRLRRTRQLCSLRVQNGAIDVVYGRDLDFAVTPNLYGLFSSRHAALDALRAIADAQRLCYGPLGLERLTPGKRCFRASIRQCAGLCCGLDTREAFDARLMHALEGMQVTCWPYQGAIGIVERNGEDMQIHVIRHWYYLGSTDTFEQAKQLAQVHAGFDADSYKIICNRVLNGDTEIIAL